MLKIIIAVVALTTCSLPSLAKSNMPKSPCMSESGTPQCPAR